MGDDEPGVIVKGFRLGEDCGGRPMVEIEVGLRYLNEDEDDEEDEDV